MKWFVAFFLTINFYSSYAADSSETEAIGDGTCVECNKEEVLPQLPEEAVETVTAGGSCTSKDSLIDPERKSILEKHNINFNDDSFLVTLGENTLTCLYGLGAGAFTSLKDLIMLVPNILKAMWNGGKAAVGALSNFTIDGFKKSVESGATTIKEFASTAWEKFKRVVTKPQTANAYSLAGAMGGLPALGLSLADFSPNSILRKFMTKIATSVAEFFKREWSAFQCLSASAQSEMLCKAIGYVAVDVITGKIAWGQLVHSPKLLEFFRKAKAIAERIPVAGKILTKDYKPAADAPNIEKWKVDSRLIVQNQQVEVAKVGNKVFARAVDPKTRELTVFELQGATARQVNQRIEAAEKLGKELIEQAGDPAMYALADRYAGDAADLARMANIKAGVVITTREAKKIAKALKTPENMGHYGYLLKAAATNGSKEVKELLKALNFHLIRFGDTFNLAPIRSAVEFVEAGGDAKALKFFTKIMDDLNSQVLSKSFAKLSDKNKQLAYEQSVNRVLAKTTNLSNDAIKAVRACWSKAAK